MRSCIFISVFLLRQTEKNDGIESVLKCNSNAARVRMKTYIFRRAYIHFFYGKHTHGEMLHIDNSVDYNSLCNVSSAQYLIVPHCMPRFCSHIHDRCSDVECKTKSPPNSITAQAEVNFDYLESFHF